MIDRTRAARWLAAVLGVSFITFLLLEASLRTRYCCGSQRAFDPKGATQKLWDQDHTVMFHTEIKTGYSKYPPNQTRRDHDEHGSAFDVTINRHGFRGRDFNIAKAPGTLRVVTLGASSTFGYHDRDDETYPHYLQVILNSRIGASRCRKGESFEVINLGVPHLTTQNILALLMEEGLALKPDFVTFYEAINDAIADAATLKMDAWSDVPFYYKVVRRLRGHSITFALIDNMIKLQLGSFSTPDLDRFRAGKSQRFIANLAAMREATLTHGGVFIVASQQAKSNRFSRERIRGVTYDQEVTLIQQRLSNNHAITYDELAMMTHSYLMQDLRSWVARAGVPFVDVSRRLDERRDHLLSWVHLAPGGNQIVASALADTIVELCAADVKSTR